MKEYNDKVYNTKDQYGNKLNWIFKYYILQWIELLKLKNKVFKIIKI